SQSILYCLLWLDVMISWMSLLHLLYLLSNIYGKNRILLHIRLITIQSLIAIQVILLILLFGVIYVRTMP
ncbi:hypothetical protein NE451_21540, partial [Bacteroides nordii]|uniref:hypothetical protein n=1 Tax=Bacteroides nordii TaxID=291645 RepID=UPI0021090F19